MSPLLAIDKIVNALDSDHLLVGQGSARQSREVLLHLLGAGWSGEADVHVGVGKDKAVTIRGGKRRLVGGHVPGFKRLAPARSGEDHDARTVVLGQVGEDVFLCAPVHHVVAHLE